MLTENSYPYLYDPCATIGRKPTVIRGAGFLFYG
jgi:hypothetical protein